VAARTNGATAGVTRAGDQAVFSSSTAPRATQTTKAKAKGSTRSSAKSTAPADAGPAASTRSATGDLWSGVASAGAKPSLASAAAVADKSGGLSGPVLVGMAILGLGLVGLTGGALATAGRRRRASAGASKQ
jgi:hypothetical protein